MRCRQWFGAAMLTLGAVVVQGTAQVGPGGPGTGELPEITRAGMKCIVEGCDDFIWAGANSHLERGCTGHGWDGSRPTSCSLSFTDSCWRCSGTTQMWICVVSELDECVESRGQTGEGVACGTKRYGTACALELPWGCVCTGLKPASEDPCEVFTCTP